MIGNLIGTDPTGNVATAETVTNAAGIRIEGVPTCATTCRDDLHAVTVTDNVIVNAGWGGIVVDKGVYDIDIADNLIGVTLDGTIVGNTTFGVRVAAGAHHVTIGPGNVIKGGEYGIQMTPFSVDPIGTTPSPTHFNTITENSISDTIDLAIDLYPYEILSGPAPTDSDVNEGVARPGLLANGGTVSAYTCAGCLLEVFEAAGNVGDSGPGTSHLLSGTADSSGIFAVPTPTGGWPSLLTATTTTPSGSTSEFALNIDPTVDGTAPGTPTSIDAVAGDAAATVTFSIPQSGGPASAYRVVATDLSDPANGGQHATGTGSPITVSGLTNGDRYTFTVTAGNDIGQGTPSTASNVVVPTSVVVEQNYPDTLGQDALYRWVQVYGSGFGAGTSVDVGDGVHVKALTVNSSTVITLRLNVDADANVGARDVTVTASNGDVGVCHECFDVGPAPQITSIVPSLLSPNTSGVLSIEGAAVRSDHPRELVEQRHHPRFHHLGVVRIDRSRLRRRW